MEPLESRQLLAADIVGAVYNDVDGNGVHDNGEAGLVNWTVFLDLDSNGSLDAGEPSALTDADGKYAIRGMAAGDYRVAEIVKNGRNATNPAAGYADVTVTDGQEKTVNFLVHGSGGTGAITGNVWRDVNANGVKDPPMDIGVAGWTVFIDMNGDKLLDPEEPFELTDGNGDYTFTGLLGGGVGNSISYEVQQVLTPGWEPAIGFDENYTAEVVEGETFVGPDFANSPVELSAVAGTVWSDLNGNGLQEGGEPGLSGWQVYADLNTNNTLDAGEPNATTDASGGYTLVGLNPGNVRIAEVQHIDFKSTSPSTGYQTVVAPNSGTQGNVNFGNQERTDAAISGVIYVDRDKDGVRDPGEEGLAGITVYIDGNNNGSLDAGEKSMLTSTDLFYTPGVDEAGTYRFDHLAAGTYIVRQIVPVELSSTPVTEREHSVTLGPADDLGGVDGGDQYRPSEIHGFQFEDVNGNHLRDAGEPGIEGVTIFLDLNRNNLLDGGEPTTLSGPDGSYEFVDLAAGAYVVREVVPGGYQRTFPETLDGILWPSGVSNPAVGNVTPTLIELSLAEGDAHTQTVSLTLPTTGALTNMVDVFLLFDDTGSFTFNSPIVRAAFPDIIAQLQTRLPGINLGFGVGRLEEYGNFAAEYSDGRPFILNQPVIASDVAGFSASIQAGLDHVAPGYGGDTPETVIESLYQMVTGAGFDGNNNGSLLDSGAAGLLSTQVSPGNSGDVPPFASFTPDPANGVLPASGSIGGAGFRSGALPIIITATDTGFAYQPKGETTITGIDGLTVPVSNITYNGRGTTPFSSGAGIQETVTGLNALGALVIGLGTNDLATSDPRIGLEAFANLTGAINRTTTSIANGTPDPIDPGDPFYFKIGTGGDPLVGNIADGIVAAIDGAVTSVNVNLTLRASDPRVHITFTPGVINGLGAGDTATFDVTFTGDGRPHRFDLQFIREGTDVVLGSIPVVLGTPISGDGYEFEDCEDGEHSQNVDFGNRQSGVATVVGRHVFYNNSKWDGHAGFTKGDPAANEFDDGAIATDKQALLPGQTGTFANYTSCARGINGIMVDVQGLADPIAVADGDLSEFVFKYGNDDTPNGWLPAPNPVEVTARDIGGGVHRVTFTWADKAIPNKNWLQVTFKAHPDTGLAADDVFYFGNTVGENTADFRVDYSDAFDIIWPLLGTPLAIGPDHVADINRDGRIDYSDVFDDLWPNLSGPDPLKPISPPVPPPALLESTDSVFNEDLSWAIELMWFDQAYDSSDHSQEDAPLETIALDHVFSLYDEE